jgi:hypothetical protein
MGKIMGYIHADTVPPLPPLPLLLKYIHFGAIQIYTVLEYLTFLAYAAVE